MFFKGPFAACFSLFLYFLNSWTSIQVIKSLPMTGYERRTPVVGSNRSTNWATTTAQIKIIYYLSLNWKQKMNESSRSWQFFNVRKTVVSKCKLCFGTPCSLFYLSCGDMLSLFIFIDNIAAFHWDVYWWQ